MTSSKIDPYRLASALVAALTFAVACAPASDSRRSASPPPPGYAHGPPPPPGYGPRPPPGYGPAPPPGYGPAPPASAPPPAWPQWGSQWGQVPSWPLPQWPAPTAPPAPTASSSAVKHWVLQVALGTEYGNAVKRCARFAHPITLSVMQGSATERAPLLELIPLLDRELRTAGSSLTLLPDGATNAAIEVHFVKLSEFDAIGQAKGFPVVPGNHGYFWTFWDNSQRITKAHVLLAKDRLSGSKLRHFTFEEVTQALGLSNDSPAFADSIFYANGADGGAAITLSALDRKLVRFHYSRVAPGFGQAQLEAAFDSHWAAMP